jgi:hypothetical protein
MGGADHAVVEERVEMHCPTSKQLHFDRNCSIRNCCCITHTCWYCYCKQYGRTEESAAEWKRIERTCLERLQADVDREPLDYRDQVLDIGPHLVQVSPGHLMSCPKGRREKRVYTAGERLGETRIYSLDGSWEKTY